ncbi:hypothetical protein OOU_Y34scaffold00588g7 [Pyricularia oryzae Y34]|uniref:Rhodopsin domain-containing protein n=1 Tax=Pyricularia oryzae (strain Y34) TaxID=1143189 RepID=A0AA97NWN8_PYRO3|nr:hypothetical protein OOU_Y34scaffold00588g7 [Pyricularia oryzae Y34]
MRWAQKLGALFILGIASLTVITSVIRLQLLPTLLASTDISWDAGPANVWSILEANLFIICGSMPTLNRFAKHFLPALMGSSSNNTGQASDGPFRNCEGLELGIIESTGHQGINRGMDSDVSLTGSSRSEVREEALAILMRILHGKNQHVPKAVNLELLAKIAVLVDYYNCPDAAGLAAEIWIPKLTPPTQVSKDLVFWLLVSWVFGRDEIFRAMIRIAIRESQGPLQTYNLPIPENITDRIDRLRREFIGDIVSSMNDLSLELKHGKAGCSYECSSMLLGALLKEMHTKGLELQSGSPLRGLSFASTMATALQIQSPSWSHPGTSLRAVKTCNLAYMIKEKIGVGNVPGFGIADINKDM